MTNGKCIYHKIVNYMSRMALEKDDFRRFSVIWGTSCYRKLGRGARCIQVGNGPNKISYLKIVIILPGCIVSFTTTVCRKQVLLRWQLCRHKKMILVSPAQKNIISGNNTEKDLNQLRFAPLSLSSLKPTFESGFWIWTYSHRILICTTTFC